MAKLSHEDAVKIAQDTYTVAQREALLRQQNAYPWHDFPLDPTRADYDFAIDKLSRSWLPAVAWAFAAGLSLGTAITLLIRG